MTPLTRREFLQTTATGAALTIGASLTGCGGEALPDSGGAVFAPDAWIRIDQSGDVLVIVDRSEMGQGVSTSLPMIVAEELDADWSRVRYQFAPANKAYYNPLNGAQITGGSTSVMAAWVPLREAAAKARVMLLTAAAAEWNVPTDDCRTVSGEVVHEESGRRLDYGALVAGAANIPPPERVALKSPDDYRLIGRPIPR
ncbi:MAG: xanthine dehydrogenase family protein molybdopterin-binding subunit, partial [Gemmatimonadales bacterium]